MTEPVHYIDINEYDIAIPDALMAQEALPRGESRLLVCPKDGSERREIKAKDLLKEFPELKKGLREQVPGMNFTVDAAIRVYLWDKAGFDIPDISKTAKARLIKQA